MSDLATRRPELLGPFLANEARRAARHGRTFAVRACYGFLLLGLVALGLSWTSFFQRGPVSSSKLADVGRVAFWVFSYGQLYLVALLAPAYGAAAIADERAERTAGLLLLTPLSPFRIVLGKLLGKLLLLELLLLAGLPLFAFCIVLGGVDLREVLLLSVLTQLVLVLSTSVALFAATLLETAVGAAMTTYLLVGGALWLPAVGSHYAGSPFTTLLNVLFGRAASASVLLGPTAVSLGTVLLALALATPLFARLGPGAQVPVSPRWRLAAGLVAAAAIALAVLLSPQKSVPFPGTPVLRAVLVTWLAVLVFFAVVLVCFLPGRRAAKSAVRPHGRAAGVWDNPVLWREVRLLGRSRRVQLAVDITCALGLVLAVAASWKNGKLSYSALQSLGRSVHGMAFFWLVLLTVQAFQDERRARTLELLAAAPLSPARVVLGKLLGLCRRAAMPLGGCYLLLAAGRHIEASAALALEYLGKDLAYAGVGLYASLRAKSARSAYGTLLVLVLLEWTITVVGPTGRPLGAGGHLVWQRLELAFVAALIGCGGLVATGLHFRRLAARSTAAT